MFKESHEATKVTRNTYHTSWSCRDENAQYRNIEAFSSFIILQSLAKSVLVSEKAVKDAMREIEMLKEQLENAKVAALKQSQRLKQDNDAGVESRSERTHRQRQHHHHHHHAQHARPRVQATHSFTSGAGSPPDLLY